MSTRPWWTPGSTRAVDVFVAAVLAVVLLLVLSAASGQIQVNHGYGYDGADYVEMVNDGITAGTPSTRLRPAVVLMATAVDRAVFNDPIATFRAINLLFAGLLALILADLARRYGASRAATLVLIVNLGLCISTAKMFSFYPTLVDLGAYACMAAGAWAIVTGRRALIVVTCVVAVLSREFAGVLVIFGLVRELRLRRPIPVTLVTYAPIAAAVVWVRWFAASHNVAGEETRALATASLIATLRQNLVWWHDPQYAAFWLYFAATLFGGVSLALITSPRPWARCVRREPEWLAIVLPIAAVTVVGYIDMWRYFAFIVPAVPVLWAWTVADLPPSRARWCFAAVTVATLITQRPWQPMDVTSYFRDWFPYFLVIEEPRTAAAALWPLWTWRLVGAGVLAVAVLWSVTRPRVSPPSLPAGGS